MAKVIKSFQSKNKEKNSLIILQDEIFIVEFYEYGKRVGEIEYTDKSYNYVEDAAENWITGVMTKETIDRYKSAA